MAPAAAEASEGGVCDYPGGLRSPARLPRSGLSTGALGLMNEGGH